MPRTETPPPISEGRTWKASRGEHLSHSKQSRGQRWPHARARLRARENGKFVLAIKLEPKAGCRLKAPDFSSPLPFLPGAGVLFWPTGASKTRHFTLKNSLCH